MSSLINFLMFSSCICLTASINSICLPMKLTTNSRPCFSRQSENALKDLVLHKTISMILQNKSSVSFYWLSKDNRFDTNMKWLSLNIEEKRWLTCTCLFCSCLTNHSLKYCHRMRWFSKNDFFNSWKMFQRRCRQNMNTKKTAVCEKG